MCKENYGAAPVHIAAGNGCAGLTKKLLAARCYVDVQDMDGATALHFAAQEGHAAVAKLLLAARCNVDLQKDDGFTPLHLAAQVDGVGVAKSLLAARSNVHLQEKDGRTALQLAQQQGHGGIGTLIRNAAQKATEERALELLHPRHHSVEPADILAQTHTHTLGGGGESSSQCEEEEEGRRAANYHGRITAVCTLSQVSAKGDDEEDTDAGG